jgi:hypothetical protein
VGGRTAEYGIWKGMRQRCTNPTVRDYHRYGGRGIEVCERWESFTAFLADVGPRPGPGYSLDRIDNDGDYEPGNVRWATAKEQQRNTDRVRRFTYQGETLTLPEWAERVGMPAALIGRRVWSGWSVEAALTTPPLRRGLRAR